MVKLLKTILTCEKRVNAFLPSKCQTNGLIRSGYKKHSSIHEWHNYVNEGSHYNVAKSPLFTSVITKGIQQYANDQMTRAKIVIEHMKEKGKKRLVTMDGHGRFVLTFVTSLIELNENLNEWEIELIDTDYQVHDWHKAFFPNWVLSRRGNIMDIATPEYLSSHNAFLYLNFCGVGDQFEELTDFILAFQREKEPLLLSYSKRGIRDMEVTKAGKRTMHWMNRILHENNITQTQLCQRGHFLTKLIEF